MRPNRVSAPSENEKKIYLRSAEKSERIGSRVLGGCAGAMCLRYAWVVDRAGGGGKFNPGASAQITGARRRRAVNI